VAQDWRLPKDQELILLGKIEDRIKSEPLKAVDSDEIGNKYTECNWGRCGISDPAIVCPMDKRIGSKKDGAFDKFYGCFYHCQVFQAPKGQTMGRKTALSLVEAAKALLEREEAPK